MALRYDIDPGRLRHSITIEQPPVTQDSTGGVYGDWTTFRAVKAEVIPAGGSERDMGGGYQAQSGYVITMRYVSGVTTVMRVNFNGKRMNIDNINNVKERNRVLVLTCTEGVTHGA